MQSLTIAVRLAHHYLLAANRKAFYDESRAGQAALEAFAVETALQHLRTAGVAETSSIND